MTARLKLKVQDSEKQLMAPIVRGIDLMIIDDDPVIHQILTLYLKPFGFEIKSFLNPLEAISWYVDRGREIRVIFLDMQMPGLNGEQVFQSIRQLNPDQNVAIISGGTKNGDVARLLERGAKAFFAKPFEFKKIAVWLSDQESGSAQAQVEFTGLENVS